MEVPSRCEGPCATSAALSDTSSVRRDTSSAIVGVFLCKDSACLSAAFSSSCCDSDCPSPPHQSPPPGCSEMDQQTLDLANARRLSLAYPVRHAPQVPYSALPGSLFGRCPPSMTQISSPPNLSLPLTTPGPCALTECPSDCYEPCSPGCDDRTDQCTPDCVQVAVPCLDSCAIPAKDCSPDTCPDILSEHTAWATTDWHAHCIPPQFTMNDDLQTVQDLQQLVILIFYIAHHPELTGGL